MLAGAVALAAVACTQEKKTGYTIQGEIADMTTGTVYLKCYQDSEVLSGRSIRGCRFSSHRKR